MKWLDRSLPNNGEKRTRKAFLFLPKKIGEETRWLEFAKWLEHYNIGVSNAGGNVVEHWVIDGWED